MAENPVCPEKANFLDAFETAASAYSDAVSDLNAVRGRLSREDYKATYLRIEELRMEARLAQEVLLRHITIHGC